MPRWLLIGGAVLIGLLLVAQIVPINRSVPADLDPQQDFLTYSNTSEMITGLVKEACYDCHSYQTEYPWYAKVAPVSFWIQNHVNHGRENLNFSTWTAYPIDKQIHKLEEIIEEVEEGHMPLPAFVRRHPEADLSDHQKEQLLRYFRSQHQLLAG